MMTPKSAIKSLSPMRSLRTRILLAISVSILLMIAGLLWLGATRIKDMSVVQIRHEGLLLSNTLQAAITDRAAKDDIPGIQAYIDSLVELREKNDLEINVVFLRDDCSEIVASNVPDNIEEADEEEHIATLAALKLRKPEFEIEVEGDFDEDSESSEEDDAEELINDNDPTHPDYYFPDGSRLLGITTPLVHNGRELGSINVKLSLHALDQELSRLTRSSIISAGFGCMFLIVLLAPYMYRKLFRPLEALAERLYAFGTGEEFEPAAPTHRGDEIGVLENEFFSMVARIKSAEAMREEFARMKAERRERELESKLKQAQKMEALGTLAGGVAHDFNNLLTPIMGYAELAMMQLPPDSAMLNDLGEVVHASHRAQDLVKQILTFSRRSDESHSPVQIAPIVKETLKLLRTSIPANVVFEHNIGEIKGAVLGSPTHIHQVVLNLATNAYQAMIEQGGRLDVSMKEVIFVKETIVGDSAKLPAGRYMCLKISDTGPGIQPEVMDRIFEPYFTTKAEGEGTGLGLAMVHGLVQDMGGAIAVGSEIGQGTTFEAYFPMVAEDVTVDSGEENQVLPTGHERILVVDDEKAIAAMIEGMLCSLGYDTCTYSDPEDAFTRICDAPQEFDLILSDVAMPGMTGIEFVKRLNGRGVRVPVILCSAYTGGINWDTARAMGIKAMLEKPIRMSDLATKVREVLVNESPRLPATRHNGKRPAPEAICESLV